MKRSAFTLIELLTVMAVLGILMGLLFPAFSGIRKRAYRTQTHNLVSQVDAAWQLHFNDFRSYPDPKFFEDAHEEACDIWFPMSPLNLCILNWRTPKPTDFSGTSAQWMTKLVAEAKKKVADHTPNKPRSLTVEGTKLPTRDAYLEISQIHWMCGLVTAEGERKARKAYDTTEDTSAARDAVKGDDYSVYAKLDTGYDGKVYIPGSFVEDAEEQDEASLVNRPALAWASCYGSTVGSW